MGGFRQRRVGIMPRRPAFCAHHFVRTDAAVLLGAADVAAWASAVARRRRAAAVAAAVAAAAIAT